MKSIFSINENSKNFVTKFRVLTETLTEDFCHEKTQSVTGRYHADKLHLVVSTLKVNYNIFTWKYIPKK